MLVCLRRAVQQAHGRQRLHFAMCACVLGVTRRQPVPHHGAEEHSRVHDELHDGAASFHYAGGRAVPVQGEADLHHGGAVVEAVPVEPGLCVG